MKIFGHIDKYYKLCLALSGSIEAYHVGKKLDEGKFNFAYIGSGEGMGALGPGIYFTDNIDLAKLYGKYSKRPYLYKAIISADKLYNPVRGEPKHLRDTIQKIEAEVLKDRKYPSYLDLFSRQENSFRVRDTELNEERRNLLKEHGIGGFYVELPSGALEICIFDLSIISLVESVPLLGTQEEYDEQVKQDLIKASKCFWCKKEMWDPSTAIDTKEDRIRRFKLEEEHRNSLCESEYRE